MMISINNLVKNEKANDRKKEDMAKHFTWLPFFIFWEGKCIFKTSLTGQQAILCSIR